MKCCYSGSRICNCKYTHTFRTYGYPDQSQLPSIYVLSDLFELGSIVGLVRGDQGLCQPVEVVNMELVLVNVSVEILGEKRVKAIAHTSEQAYRLNRENCNTSPFRILRRIYVVFWQYSISVNMPGPARRCARAWPKRRHL